MKKLLTLAAIVALTSWISTSPASAADAEKVYKFYCAQCHGLTGKGDGPNVTKDFPVSPRNFTEAKEMDKLTDADLKNVILDGGPSVSKSPMMPPWSKTLTVEQVDGLVKHLRGICKCKGKQG
ncbi:MAG: c-type cytochrome [Alphaproteobacteria bacterium]|jgi:cytochrome c oxidase cbb3-type subunit 3|nr:c-type cytochrome [Alphaproteobacteria bacterium]MBT4084226.1 c-type cytochrome [Alphaproteobacteria bacterium]MBT4543565.1 c-type cytochrome [Alphaproteobacteria bacterium]MBT5919136.1 c-type cytochrome [Alphaproteobacteria bacterium]MBT7745709.1 c-type cytochrome [Alphaproteobacteria bacterium]